MKDKRSPIIVVTFVIILILLLLWGKGDTNKTIVNQGDVNVDTPRFPDYDLPPLIPPAFGGNKWDWMNTTDCACDCGPHDDYKPINISGPSIYIYRAPPAVYNLPPIAPMPAPPTFDYTVPEKPTFTYYRDVWANTTGRWALDERDRSRLWGDAKEAFRSSDGRVFFFSDKMKGIKGIDQREWYFGTDGETIHWKGNVYVPDHTRDRFRWDGYDIATRS